MLSHDDDVSDLDSEVSRSDADATEADFEADRLLEEMRKLNRDVASAVDGVGGATEVADVADDKMHSRLDKMVVGIIHDVVNGVDLNEAPEEPPPAASASAADDSLQEENWQVPEMPVESSLTAASTMSGTGRGGRFNSSSVMPAAETRSVVSSISSLASKPLLPNDPIGKPGRPRPGGRGGGLASASRVGR